MKQMLSNAIAFATEKHDGQFDKSGLPYILHVLKVMHYLKTEDEELMCIAVLHDVIEDCYEDYDSGVTALQSINMTQRVIDGVVCMTRFKDETYVEYIENLIKNKDAIKVKMCDLRHNMDIRRLKGVTEKDLKRIEKYAKTYTRLKEELEKINESHFE